MAKYLTPDATTAGESIRHWLAIFTLTLLGLLVAELPVLSQTRNRVYLWLQERLQRDYKSVVVLTIDDDEFWRGQPGGRHPLDRRYLADLVTRVSNANPAVIALDVGFEMNDSVKRPQWDQLTDDERSFLLAVEEAAKRCPVILPRTISGDEYFLTRYDLFDAKTFASDARIAYGHTSSARDPRQIPTRIYVNSGELLDSFPVAVLRRVMRKLPSRMEDPKEPWPYSFFLPNSAFVAEGAPVGADGLTPVSALRQVSPRVAKNWLERQIVLIGGTWRKSPHGGALADGHETPLGTLPGVVLHANYVQSVLWGPMYGMPRRWRLAVEVLLSVAVSVFFLIAHSWRRVGLVLATLVSLVVLTWVFSSAIGVFFDMVVPIAFIGLHALWEGASETFRLEFRQSFRYSEHVFTSVAGVALLGVGVTFLTHELDAADRQVATEDRLQVTMLSPAPSASPPFPVASRAPSSSPLEAADGFRFASTLNLRKRPKQPSDLPTAQYLMPETQSTSIEQPPPKPDMTPKLQRQEPPGMVPELQKQYAVAEFPASHSPWILRTKLDVDVSTTQVRVASATVRASSTGERPVLNLVIEHEAPLKGRNSQVLFASPSGICGEQLSEAAAAKLSASGARVLQPWYVQTIVANNGLTIDSLDAAKMSLLGRIVGGGALVLVTVQNCTTELSARGQLPEGLTSKTSQPLGHSDIRASVRIVDLADGVLEGDHQIQAGTRLTAGDLLSDRLYAAFSSSTPDYRVAEQQLRESAVSEAAKQIQQLFFDWTEEVRLPFFDDSACGLQNAVTRLQKNDIKGAANAADDSILFCIDTRPADRSMLAKAHYNAALTRFLSGHTANALAHLRSAQQLAPDTTFDTAETILRRMMDTTPDVRPIGQAPAAAAAPDAESDHSASFLLRRLADLYEKGLITKEEYERKRREILGPDKP